MIFLWDRAPFKVDHVVAIEPARNFDFASCHRIGRLRQQIAGQLLNRELIERQVAIEAVDNPLPPASHVATVVDVIAVRVGKACRVEPFERHPFAVMR